jgi:hypothetical protein
MSVIRGGRIDKPGKGDGGFKIRQSLELRFLSTRYSAYKGVEVPIIANIAHLVMWGIARFLNVFRQIFSKSLHPNRIA